MEATQDQLIRMPPHQKSARMKVCTTSDSSTMMGHRPEPRADMSMRLPSRICTGGEVRGEGWGAQG